MINLDELNELNETIVLTAMGNQLMKECCYICNSNDDAEIFTEASDINFFRRAIDFLNRILIKFIAWIKKGQLKKLGEKLEKLLKDPKRNNFYQDDNDLLREFYTRAYSSIFIIGELNTAVADFYNLDLVKIIDIGPSITPVDVKSFDRSKLDTYISELLKAEKKFKRISSRMTGETPRSVERADENKMRIAIKGTIGWIEIMTNKGYDTLNKCFKAIKIVQKNEKELNLKDSKDVSKKYTRAMTIMAECFLHLMTITQKIGSLYVTGSTKRRFSKDNKTIGYKNLTVQNIYTELAKEFNDNSDADANGVYLGMKKLDDEHFRVEIFFQTSTSLAWTKSKHYIPCDQISNAARSYIRSHSAPANVIKRSDIT